MVANNFRLKTQGNYDLFEVISALQKSVRRGLEKEALYWSMELLPRYEAYLWRRLRIIASEDIGIANPSLIVLIQTLSDQYFELRKRGDMGCLLMLSNSILLMCRSKKSRIADHFICQMIQEREQGILHLEIPNFGLDMHTRKGKALKRGLQHFKEHGAKLNNKDLTIHDPYEERSYELDGSKNAKSLKFPKLNEEKYRKETKQDNTKGENGRLFD